MRQHSSSLFIALLAIFICTPAVGAPMTLRLPAATSGPATIEVQSWSWGTSHPRDVATGQASGKRQHGAVMLANAEATQDLSPDAVVAGQDVELTLQLPAGADSGISATACAAGLHYQKIEVTWQARLMQLADAVLTCDAPAVAQVAGAAGAKQKQWLVSNFRLRGHVTLIK